MDPQIVKAASDAGGAYLDKAGVTDLARLTEYQWHQFLCDVLESAAIAQARQTRAFADQQVPF